MKRSWISALVIGGVLLLLTLFLGLQYKWLSEVSDAGRERMQKRVEMDASRFGEDFDREMQAAYFNFQTGAAVWKKSEWDEFNARYDFWKERTSYPELIREIYFLRKQPDAAALKYDAAGRTFKPTEVSPELQSLRGRFTAEKNSRTVYDDVFAMVLPIYDDEKRIDQLIVTRIEREGPGPAMHLPDKFGWLVIMLDEPTIKNRVLPDLVAKYFSESDYKLAVVNKGGESVFATQQVTGDDATAKMFRMSPDNLFFFGKRDGLPRILEEHKKGIIVDQRVESHTFSRTENVNGKTSNFSIELKQPAEKQNLRTAMIAQDSADGSPWTLRVQHTAGSIDAFVRGERNKSFALGLGIYLLLVGGIMGILISAMRSRRFAQRQIDFVSSVSHEFRTPLAVIYSAGENLADGVAKETGQVARYGDLIKGEGKKLSTMVEQILEFAGANSGKQKYSFAPVDVRAVIEDALKECRPLIESGGFDVETDFQNDLPRVSADRTALSSAIQNLIANSVKYSNGSAWIKLSAANGGGRVKIVVEDKGIGISGVELRQIFEPFYRAKQVVDAQISGNGLGLNLVKNIVEAHGGKVSVESSIGAGSTFTIEIPQGKFSR
ncbi:MAG TPA: HAMP domain-containing sensor histidine kinase [Pyrinomonadaceae bacterium]|nr:HAMP domain-containing sensor histidine kinase [Pyrinomonadaceae bacterium]